MTNVVSYFTYNTPIGKITIASNGESISRIAFGEVKLEGIQKATALTNVASTQLLEYLAGKRMYFDVPLYAHGTQFQQEVWDIISGIPYGETRSYTYVAKSLGNPKATRAVGMASNRNPLPIFIPCHRVVGANGKPVGYAGGLKIKQFLLELEQKHYHPAQ